MQEGDELTSSPLVWFRKIQIFEVQDQSLAVLGSVDSTCVTADHHTHLGKFLQNMRRRSLSTAVDHGHLGRPQLTKTVLQEQPGKQNAMLIKKSIQ